MVLEDKEIAYLRQLEESSARQAKKRKRNIYIRFSIVAIALAARGVVLLTWPNSYYVADLLNSYNEGDLLLQVVIARMTIVIFFCTAYFYSIQEHFYSQTVNACAITAIIALIWIDAEYILANLAAGPVIQVYLALSVRIGCIFFLVLNHYDLLRGVD